MKRVLAITVGRSLDPVVKSIRDHKPDFTLFLVSDRPDGGSRKLLFEAPEGGRGIISQAGLREGCYDEVVLPHADDFASCYTRTRNALRSTSARFPDANLIADFTGGTKTMSAAMAAAAVRLGWKLSLVESPRSDLNRAQGTGVAVVQSVSPLVLDEAVEQLKLLFEGRHFEGAKSVLEETMRDLVLEPTLRANLLRAVNLLQGLARWDQFAYTEAYNDLRQCGEVCTELLRHLASLDKFARNECSSPPYELVWDLLANAESRAAQGRYEDAILRLYRAVELLAQTRLMEKHGLDTSDLELPKIPEPLRTSIETRCRGWGRFTAGLMDAYQILLALEDPLGKHYGQGWNKRLLELLILRNKAFMEHGFRPLGKEEWQKAYQIAHEFLSEGAKCIKVRMAVPSAPSWEAVVALLPT